MPSSEPAGPVILRFERPSPEPILRIWKTYIIGRRPYRMLGERWLEEDTHHLEFVCLPDPHRPGTSISWRMFDDAGHVIAPVSEPTASVPLGFRTPHPGA